MSSTAKDKKERTCSWCSGVLVFWIRNINPRKAYEKCHNFVPKRHQNLPADPAAFCPHLCMQCAPWHGSCKRKNIWTNPSGDPCHEWVLPFEGRPRSGVILATTSERSTNSCREKYSFRFLGPVAVATEGTNADYSKKISQVSSPCILWWKLQGMKWQDASLANFGQAILCIS